MRNDASHTPLPGPLNSIRDTQYVKSLSAKVVEKEERIVELTTENVRLQNEVISLQQLVQIHNEYQSRERSTGQPSGLLEIQSISGESQTLSQKPDPIPIPRDATPPVNIKEISLTLTDLCSFSDQKTLMNILPRSLSPTSNAIYFEHKGGIRSHLSDTTSISLHPRYNLVVTTSNDNQTDLSDLTIIFQAKAGGSGSVEPVCHYLTQIDDPYNPARPTASVFLPAIYSDNDIARGYPKYKETIQASPSTQPPTDIKTILKRYLSPSETVETLKSCLGCILVGDSQGFLALYSLAPTNYRHSSPHHSLNSQLMTRQRAFDLDSSNPFSRDNGIILMDTEEMGQTEYQPGIPSMRVVCVTRSGTAGLFVVTGTFYSVTGLQNEICRGSIKRIALSSTKPTKDDIAIQVFFKRREVPSIILVWKSGAIQQLKLQDNRLVLTKTMTIVLDKDEFFISSSFYPSSTKLNALSPTHLCILTNRSRVVFVDINVILDDDDDDTDSRQCLVATLPESPLQSLTDKPAKIAGGHGGMIITMSTHSRLQAWSVSQDLSRSEPSFVMRGFSQETPSKGSPNAFTRLFNSTPIQYHYTSGFLIASTNSSLNVYKVTESDDGISHLSQSGGSNPQPFDSVSKTISDPRSSLTQQPSQPPLNPMARSLQGQTVSQGKPSLITYPYAKQGSNPPTLSVNSSQSSQDYQINPP
ncbi:hypothetical protein BLNAU_148 [Blattamonas nauphoetae]|uniref:Uncharacterized protein n=1 Tax=Blattamonas nauphoetae TaxID=2049346 RepID=A0ABQ9YM56_9EUKA|nr:hypothetical protein BLNAU_148 [Blattamonas nauphoetae]